MKDTTICMMDVHPKLIEIRREYAEKCRKQWEMMRNVYPQSYGSYGGAGLWMAQGESSKLSALIGGASNLLGGL